MLRFALIIGFALANSILEGAVHSNILQATAHYALGVACAFSIAGTNR